MGASFARLRHARSIAVETGRDYQIIDECHRLKMKKQIKGPPLP
jgi:hypothetical protein